MHEIMGIELYSKEYFIILFVLVILWAISLGNLIMLLLDDESDTDERG